MMKKFSVKMVWIALLAGIASCQEKDLYDPTYGEQDQLKPVDEYFDFSMRADVDAEFSLGKYGKHALIELYAENPFTVKNNYYAKKDEVEALFKIYADADGNWKGKIVLPKAVTKLYLCPNNLGLPVVEEVNVENGSIKYVYKASVRSAATRSTANGSSPIYVVDEDKKMYSLCQWGVNGQIKAPEGYVIDGNLDADWVRSIQRVFWNGQDSRPANNKEMDNSKYETDVAHVNTTIASQVKNEDGTVSTITEASVYFTFLAESAWNQNVIGYYYYPKDQVPASADNVKKFIIFPNVSESGNVPFLMQDYENDKYCEPEKDTSKQWLYRKMNAPLKLGDKVKLLFQNEDGTVSDKFPAGYTIGYFLISNGYGNGYGEDHRPYDVNLTPDYMGNLGYIYSNQAWNTNGKSSFISLTDRETNRVVYGIEDGTDTSYEDVLFIVETDPAGAIYDPDRPVVPPVNPVEVTDKRSGTLLFEDIWPSGGDYDMNDVIVEYTQNIIFELDSNENNIVKKIVDEFTPVWNGATYTNAFAYQIDAAQVGTLALPEGAVYEEDVHSIVVYADNLKSLNKKFTITRTFNGELKKEDIKAYNPYIIVHYQAGASNRQEVHLPKMLPTDRADKSLNYTGDDAYYIDKGGKYPFAMDVPVLNFTPVTERSRIGSAGEYSGFNHWVNGESGYESWYLKKNE